jgi:5-(carboxyamino)imidazole ribonucleotide synthase
MARGADRIRGRNTGMIPPGGTIGIMGGGQLGRMLAIAAANLGYRTHIYAPGMSGPAT